MYSAPLQCPTCDHPLHLRELGCSHCGTVVRGTWAANPFGRLNADQQTFLLLFVRSRGNLSDVERTLGVSYPTVRAKLEDVIAALEEPEPAARPEADAARSTAATTREALLDRIAAGEIDVDEGLRQLRQLGGRRNQDGE